MPERRRNENLLFVYGTLRFASSHDMACYLQQHCQLISDRAWVVAALYDLGAYPGLVLETPGHKVFGDLLSLNSPQTWPVIDQYEGTQFERREEPVLTANREHLAWTYVYLGPTVDRPPITNGDFLTYQARKGAHSSTTLETS